MTNRQIENRIKKLQQIESQQKALNEEAEALKAELKAELEALGTEELTTSNGFIVRWKTIMAERFDSRSFKAAMPEIYRQFIKQSSSRRFTVA